MLTTIDEHQEKKKKNPLLEKGKAQKRKKSFIKRPKLEKIIFKKYIHYYSSIPA